MEHNLVRGHAVHKHVGHACAGKAKEARAGNGDARSVLARERVDVGDVSGLNIRDVDS